MGTVHDIDEQRRVDLTRVVIHVLHEWGVEPPQQAMLLGLAGDAPNPLLERFRQGMPAAEEAGILQRMSYILSIRNALHQMHPHSAAMANYWVTTAHPYFNGQSPLQIMLNQGKDGMRRILDHLNGSGHWG
jgi:hypothetical protein